MFFKNRCNITAVLIAGLLGISMVTGLTACGGDDGTKVVFTTGFGKNEVFRIGDESCSKAEIMIYLTTIQNQYANVYGTEIWNTSLNGVTLEDKRQGDGTGSDRADQDHVSAGKGKRDHVRGRRGSKGRRGSERVLFFPE